MDNDLSREQGESQDQQTHHETDHQQMTEHQDTPAEQQLSHPMQLPIVEPKSNKRPWIIAAILLLVVAVGGGAYAYFSSTNTAAPVTTSVAPTPIAKAPVVPVPDSVIYQVTTIGKSTAQCGTSTSTVYRQLLTDTDKPLSVLNVESGQSVGDYETYKSAVLLTTTPNCDSKSGPALWLSTDSGKTFSKLYQAPSLTSSITSAKFSDDGKTIVFGYLADAAGKNTIKELDIATKQTKDIFTATSAGVYIKGYDHTKGKIYYIEGCYACDATTEAGITVYDTAKKTSELLFKDDAKGYDTTLKPDFAKALKLYITKLGAVGSDDYNMGSYVIGELDTQKKTKKELTTTELDDVEQNSVQTGYTNEGSVYYTKARDLYTLDGNGNSSLVLHAEKPIVNVYYVSKDTVIYKYIYRYDPADSKDANTETYTDKLVRYDTKSKTSKPIVTFTNHDAVILGVTYK